MRRPVVGRFAGRDIIQKPTCPFCGVMIEKPRELATRIPSEMPMGACSCGAAYACDVTGHNLGTAMIEALVFACNDDWDLAWTLLPEKDYLEEQVADYDLETHMIIHGGVHQGRRISGTLYFIRLVKDMHEVTEKTLPPFTGVPLGTGTRKPFTKDEVEASIRDYRLEPLLEAAKQDKKLIWHLKRLLYSGDELTRWKAADALGKIAGLISDRDPGAISKLLQGLFTSVADTAASSWGALDAIGEIISNRPEQFSGYVRQLYQFASDRALLAEVLRALANITGTMPELAQKEAFRFVPLLRDPDPRIRGYAALLLGNARANEARPALEELLNDPETIEIYHGGKLKSKSIGELASAAFGKLE